MASQSYSALPKPGIFRPVKHLSMGLFVLYHEEVLSVSCGSPAPPLCGAGHRFEINKQWKGFGPNPGQAGLREVTCLRSCNSRQQSQDSDDICVTPPTTTSDAQPLCCNAHHRGFRNNTTLCIFLVKKP